jgi:hypothetical protein
VHRQANVHLFGRFKSLRIQAKSRANGVGTPNSRLRMIASSANTKARPTTWRNAPTTVRTSATD